MKHFATPLFLCGILFCAFMGCTPEEVTPDKGTKTDNDTTPQDTTATITYDYRLDGGVTYMLVDNQWKLWYKYEYIYSGDKQTGYVYYVWRDNQWEPWDKHERSYNSLGNYISFVNSRWLNEEWKIYYAIYYDNYEYISDTDYIKWHSYHTTLNQYDNSTGALESTSTSYYKHENDWTISASKNGNSKKNRMSPAYELGLDPQTNAPFMPMNEVRR